MIDLSQAVVYDIETVPNCFLLSMEMLNSDITSTWEISEFRDDRKHLREWFDHIARCGTPMISFNGDAFDYIVIHYLFHNPFATVEMIYNKAMDVIKSRKGNNRFGQTIWERDRFAPQIDLFRINHFDNKAKTTSLKALQINMRAPSVVDSPLPFDRPLTRDEIDRGLVPYNQHDVRETKRFAHICMDMINFRINLVPTFGIEVLNYNDGKIGAKMLEQRLGDDVCYDRSSGRKVKRQTPRHRVALRDIIFPYISFQHPEFIRILDWMKEQNLTSDDLDDPEGNIKTKGVFKDVIANVGGIEFKFGTGGIHGSVSSQRIIATDEWEIHDIDVEGLYPNIAIKNRLAPAHLGEAFINEYAKIPIERKQHAKGTYENASLKLASNVPWGQSNNQYSIFFDPQYAMTVPINGQLMLCMLAEWLLHVPTFKIIQINTDGITYYIHRDYQPQAKEICERWEAFTLLKLEYARYARMWIRDVNNYVAEGLSKSGSNEPPKLKQKGAYWHPDPFDYNDSITKASPPCWYKDFNPVVVSRAAVQAMVNDVDPDLYIRFHTDPFDFMLRERATGESRLLLGGRQVQNTLRYYVARDGEPLVKLMPAQGPIGEYKRKNRISDAEFNAIARTLPPGTWDERIHTQNKSRYETRTIGVQAGWKIAECNDARSFRFDNVNYDWYINEARKLIIT